jgi:glycerol-3-phosphate dehydrogenase (NAD(P)+)
MKISSVGVIGGGAWGTALAQTMALAGHEVKLWAYEPETIHDINDHHVNRVFLPGVALDESVVAIGKLAEVAACDVVLLVPPAQHLRRISNELKPHVPDGRPVVVCAKGIEQSTGKLMGEIVAEVMPGALHADLSGPSFAADVARGLPAAVTLACQDEDAGRALAEGLGYRNLRIYWSSDTIGVELGGAVKNVLAIAAGIVDGRELGKSAHAALVTRGFSELRRFSEALGARAETLMGLSGLGDLILTCSSPQSRNMSLGRELGRGRSMKEVLGERRAVTEGVFTAEAVMRIADERGIELPICAAVNDIVQGRLTVDDAIERLMSRPQRAED